MKEQALCILAGWGMKRCGTLSVLGINQRNLGYIYPSNDRKHYPVADDKLKTKDILAQAGVPPETYKIYSHFFELLELEKDLAPYRDFVVKPSQGSGGGGIIVVSGCEGRDWKSIGGTIYTLTDFKKHLSDILFGVYSFDLADRALIEARIVQHEEMSMLSPFGLADVRVIMYRDEPALAMARIPTKASEGRANLHQGAVGVGVDLATGQTIHAVLNGGSADRHPDTGETLIGRRIPFWGEVVDVSRRAAKAVPLKYLGADISISQAGPVLLELNVRPGLEIQNANLRGLRSELELVG
jgi:alpha-L-glutamate ligase-like protein